MLKIVADKFLCKLSSFMLLSSQQLAFCSVQKRDNLNENATRYYLLLFQLDCCKRVIVLLLRIVKFTEK